MRRALAACLALSVGGTPLGVFLVLRRMSLLGDAMSHAVLPGVSIAFFFCGLSLWAMTLGGLATGLLVACLAGCITRMTPLKEDASFTSLFLLSLAVGVMMISMKGSSLDLMHILFGNVLAVDDSSLLLIATIASISALGLAMIYRNLTVACLDSDFLRVAGCRDGLTVQIFLALVALSLVSGFQALGTLMALGIILLPAIASQLWAKDIEGIMAASVGIAVLSSVGGLLLSYHQNMPSGPAIVLTAGALYAGSLFLGPQSAAMRRFFPRKHLTR